MLSHPEPGTITNRTAHSSVFLVSPVWTEIDVRRITGMRMRKRRRKKKRYLTTSCGWRKQKPHGGGPVRVVPGCVRRMSPGLYEYSQPLRGRAAGRSAARRKNQRHIQYLYKAHHSDHTPRAIGLASA